MKIHAVIRAFEVEPRTRDGWTLVQAMPASNYEKVLCDTPIPVEGYDGNANSGSYGSAGTVQHTNREELVQVHEPVFLVAKELEVISREEGLKKELQDEKDKVKLAEQRHANDTRDMGLLTTKASSLEETKTVLQTQLSTEQTLRRKLEADLGKIRLAIGMTRYDEILAG